VSIECSRPSVVVATEMTAAATRTIGAHHSPDSEPAMPRALSSESVPGPIAETPVAIAMIVRLYS